MNALMRGARSMMRQFATGLPFSGYIISYADKFLTRKAALVASTPDTALLCAVLAEKYGTISEIHPKDFIFQYILRKVSIDPRIAVSEYFDTGKTSASKLSAILREDIGLNLKPIKLLEFASGYGCVSRHLVNFEDIQLFVSDIHDEARIFYGEHLKVEFVASNTNPENFGAPTNFDVVFALSFFTHMPEKTWTRWLIALFQCVVPGGHLIFTTHGLVSHANFGSPKLSDNGFRFVPRSEQLDLAPTVYGSTITTPKFVKEEIAKLANAKILLLREGDWWGHQDLYVVQKTVPGSADIVHM